MASTLVGDIPAFALSAVFNLAVALVIVRGIYYPATRDKNHVFSFLAFNSVIFCVLSLLRSVELSVGVGFGLFAIFSILNYRTTEMSIREMTYLFTLIALPVMNAFILAGDNLPQVLVANALVVLLMWVLEREWGFHFESNHRLTYDRLELITPAQREQLLADLRRRTGLPVKRVEIGRIDFVRDTAELRIFYDQARTASAAPVTYSQELRVAPAQGEAA
jgi:hypothetical protein